MEACSICFENNCELSLPHCQDQFCKTCLKRYFEYKVKESWGLEVQKFYCPVCNDHLPYNLVAQVSNKKGDLD